MNSTRSVTAIGILCASLFGMFLAVDKSAAQASSSSPADARAVLDQYCVTCHSEKLRTGGIRLDKGAVDPARLTESPAIWEAVAKKLNTGAMPPPKMPRPNK